MKEQAVFAENSEVLISTIILHQTLSNRFWNNTKEEERGKD